MNKKSYAPERLIIRPPNEWRSLLIRITRGCSWNRCKFCGIYPALGQPEFSARPVDDIKKDIDWYAGRFEGLAVAAAFLGDADPLSIPLSDSADIISYLRATFPSLERITAYGRASTMRKIGDDGLRRLREAGLTRIHMGLESGDLQTLKFHFKGQTPRIVIEACAALRKAGIEISLYVLLGLGGLRRWREHIGATADVINRVKPDFVRLRRLWLFKGDSGLPEQQCPLWKEIENKTFEPQSPEGTVIELKQLIEKLDSVDCKILCDHANNYIQVSGRLGHERNRMIKEIDEFLSLPQDVREQHYGQVGSRI